MERLRGTVFGRLASLALLGIVCIALAAGCAAGPTEAGRLLEFDRSGGLAGADDRLVIQQDGQATLTQKGVKSQFKLSADRLSALQNALAAVDFSGLQKDYRPDNPGADFFEYTLIYQNYQIKMIDIQTPKALQPLVELLSQVIDQRGA